MRFTISVRSLQHALKLVRDIKMVAGPLEGIAATYMKLRKGEVVFTSYNGESLVRTTTLVSSDEEGEFVFDAAAVYGAVSSFHPASTSDLVFQVSDKTRKLAFTATTTYSNGTKVPHKRSFALMGREGFPDFSNIDSIENSFTIKAAHLTDGVDAAAFALSSDRNNIIFTGMYLQVVEGKIRIVSTNGICLAEYSSPFEYSGKPYNIVVPGAVATRISRCFFEDDLVNVCITDRHFFVKSSDMLIGGPLICEEFPDYKEVIRPAENKVKVDKGIVLENLLNLSNEAAGIPDSRVSVLIDNGSLTVKCGEAENTGLVCEGFSGKFSFDCNVRLLISTIKSIYGDMLEIGFSAPDAPLHFNSTGSSDAGATMSCVLVPLSTL